jgi:2-polyprenyl-3-methyl-5-hydroxy-6-metoxy-1,4-benzoquinol methylase
VDKKYFEEYYYLERNHWWFKARMKFIKLHLEEIINQFPSKDNLSILNVGAGTGYTTEVLSNYGNVTSVEYDSDCCKLAKDKVGLVYENESITNLPYKEESFDIVTAFDVIEHVEDHKKAVSELIRVTKKGGLIYTTVPAYMFLWSNHDVVNQHVRRYTMSNFLYLLKEHDLAITLLYKTYFNFFLFPPIALFRLISKLLPAGSFRKGAGSDFTLYESGFTDKVLYFIMSLESFFIRNKISLPFGVSILTSFKKIK